MCSCHASAHGWCADRRSAREDVDDDHRRAAVPADEGRGPGCKAGVVRWRVEVGHDVQQLAYLGEIGAAHRIGEQPVVTDAMEPAGQHVKQETTHELVGRERHGLVARAPLLAVVLPAEGHAALIEGKQTLVGDRYAVCR